MRIKFNFPIPNPLIVILIIVLGIFCGLINSPVLKGNVLFSHGDGDTVCIQTQYPETTCDDTIDNDCDGLADGADSDCAGGLTAGRSIGAYDPNGINIGAWESE